MRVVAKSRREFQAEGAARTKTVRENLANSRSQTFEVMIRELRGNTREGWNESQKVSMAWLIQVHVGHGKKFGFNLNGKPWAILCE